MIRPLAISLLLCTPAGAATVLHPIQIEECRAVPSAAYQSMTPGEIKPNTALADCAWPGPTENPFPYDAMADLKGPRPDLPESAHPVDVLWPASRAADVQRNARTGGASAFSSSLAGASSFFSHTHGPGCTCGCSACEMPIEQPEQPAPVPLPASALLLLAGLYGLWRMKR